MGLWLKQSTAVDFLAGAFIDDADGKTAETGLTVTSSEVRLSKNGGNMAAKNEATALSHDELGYYVCKLDATDTNTLGKLQVMIYESGALPVYHEFMVVRADVYDTMCSTDYLQVDVIQVGSTTQTATDLKDLADTGYDPATHKVQGVVLADTTTTCTTTTTNTDMVTSATIETACDNALDNAIGGAPTAGSIAERIKTLDDAYTATRAGYLDELAAANIPTDLTNIHNKTTNLPADPASETNVNANETKIDTLTANVAALNDIAAADVWSEAMEGAVTAKQQMNIQTAFAAGKSNGGGTATINFRDQADSKNRIAATVDANGNRTAIAVDGA